MTSITIQRWISDSQTDLVMKFFKPLMDRNTGWLIYEEDDLMFDGTICDGISKDDLEAKYGKMSSFQTIPLFNRGRKAFEGKKVQSNIQQMMNAADFVITTTDYLKEVYHDIYGVPLENIIARPNLLPKYLFDDRYDRKKKEKDFGKKKSKPRIGIVSSLSHFNIDNVREDKNGKACRESKLPDGTSKWINEDNVEVPFEETSKILDDFDEITECVRSTVNDFQWVCFGYCPPQIKDLADKGLIETHPGVPIQNYPSQLEKLQFQAIVAPINKTTFNFCKSFIKTMEAAAIGVPLFATNCLPYSRVMDREFLFDTGAELKEKLLKFKSLSPERYGDIIEKNWKWLNSPCHEGSYDIRSFWLEDNLNIFVDMMRLRSKTLCISFKDFVQQYEARKKKEQEDTIFKNDNILITK